VEGSGGGRGRVDRHDRTELPRPSASAEGTSEESREFAAIVLFVEMYQYRAFLSRLLNDGTLRFRMMRRMGRGMTGLEYRAVAWSHRGYDVLEA
jgi:hypothetical protein